MTEEKEKKKLPLHIQIIIGLVLGAAWAVLSSTMGWSSFTLNWIAPWGDIFINLLKLIAVPLVLFSIVQGVTGLSDITGLGRLGAKTIGAYLVTTLIAIGLGLTLVNVIKPGALGDDEQRIVNRLSYEMWAGENDVPVKDDKKFLQRPEYQKYLGDAQKKNIEQQTDEEVQRKREKAESQKDDGPLKFVVDMVPENIFWSFNEGLMLQVIFFAIFFGVTIVTLPREKVITVVNFVNGSSEIFIKMVGIVMKGAPFFVFALLAGKLSEMAGDEPGRVLDIFQALGWYSLVVVVGLALMIFVVYPLITILVVKELGYKDFFRAMSAAQFLAFSSSSSAATLPVTMNCVHKNLKVKEEITGFVLPIGATINMDGTSLYQAIAVIFLAQFHFVDLDFVQQLTIILTATLASIGSAAVPSAGIIMLIVVLESVGLNPAWIAIIFPIDRILDMCRTVVNVTGDAAVSSIIAKSEGKMDYGLKTEEGVEE